MNNKVSALKEIRTRTHDLDPQDQKFDEEYHLLSSEALGYLEPVNDQQEKNWIEKGRNLLKDPDVDQDRRDKALSYLKQAVHTIILRQEGLES